MKTSKLILETLAENPTITLAELAERMKKSISAVERASSKLLKEGKFRYIGPKKVATGRWWRAAMNNIPLQKCQLTERGRRV